jgi:hypothetical protein
MLYALLLMLSGRINAGYAQTPSKLSIPRPKLFPPQPIFVGLPLLRAPSLPRLEHVVFVGLAGLEAARNEADQELRAAKLVCQLRPRPRRRIRLTQPANLFDLVLGQLAVRLAVLDGRRHGRALGHARTQAGRHRVGNLMERRARRQERRWDLAARGCGHERRLRYRLERHCCLGEVVHGRLRLEELPAPVSLGHEDQRRFVDVGRCWRRIEDNVGSFRLR